MTASAVFYSRYIGDVTPEIIYFHYLKKTISGSKYPKNILFIFENRSTGASCIYGDSMPRLPHHIYFVPFRWIPQYFVRPKARKCSPDVRVRNLYSGCVSAVLLLLALVI